LILTTNPLLGWNRVIGVEKYTVKISNAQGIIWQTSTSDNQIIYLGSPPLSPGISYSVVVETDKFSSLEPGSPLQFILLHPEDIKAIEMEVEKIKSLGLPLGVEALTLAEFYAAYSLPLPRLKNYAISPQVASTYHLSATAIALLETAISKESSSPILERTLGDIYWQIGLAELALKHYQQAIALATSPETLEEKTLAQFALGEVYAALGNKIQAQNWYAQARAGYLSLGHQERADFIGELIKTLQ
jgi:tetratricopeptide (TPR) repeat protein